MTLHAPTFVQRTRRTTRLLASSLFVVALGSAPAVAAAQGAPAQGAAAPTPQAVKKATDAFQQGTKLYQQKKFAAALDQFRLSYDTVSSPNSLLYMARCQAEMGNLLVAFRTFQKVIVEADARAAAEPKYVPTRESAKTEVEDLSNKISVLTVNVGNAKESTRLKVGGAIIPREEWGKPIPLEPGPVDVSLETDGEPTATEKLQLTKSERKTLDLAVPEPKDAPPPPPPPPPPESGGPSGLLIGAIVAGTIGVGGMVMFGVAGGMSLSTYGDVEDTCSAQPGGRCSAQADLDKIDEGEQQQLIANIGAIIGGVGLATGATLLIVDLAGGGSASAEAAGRPVDVAVGPGYVGVRGAF